MPVLKHRVLPVVAGAAVVVCGADLAAYAANGHAFLLGRGNAESSTASLTNHGRGPALSVTTGDDAPPFAVSSRAKVRHLNADRLDSHDAADLQTRTTTYALPRGVDAPFSFLLEKVRPGTYLATYDVVLNTTGDAVPSCSLEVVGSEDIRSGLAYGPAVQASAVSGSSLLDVPTRGRVYFACENAVAITDNPPADPSTVTLLEVDHDASGSVALR
jgi:hypothetical protein